VSVVSQIACSMIARTLVVASVSCTLPMIAARSQSGADISSQQQDRSFYLGMPVAHPEDISGLWEAPDPRGGAIGIHLLLDTTAPVDATALVGIEQKWLGLQVNPYRRAGAEIQVGEENSFSDSPRGGNARYENGRLTLHFPGYDLDLHHIPGDKWTGRFHREGFDSIVTLARPIVRTASNQPWFVGTLPVGTWRSTSGPQTTCLHIAQASPPAFLAWSDTLSTWGAARFAPQAAKPPYSWEHYGDLVKVQLAESGSLWVEIPAYSAICCSHRFHATSTDNGKAMKADWPAGPNQSPHKSRWTKMPGDTCIAPLSK
jgi:hypothetical protein